MRIIEPSTSKEIQTYYDLRWQVLRAPWQQPRGSERDSLDAGSIHLMVIDESGNALGVGRLNFNSDHEAQIRYMAVAPAQQRRGIGRRLLQALEQRAASDGASRIVLNARDTAQGFYRSQGYIETGPGHLLFGCIKHVGMQKIL